MLGLKCLAKEDCFSFDGVHISENLLVTKRGLLSCIARLFDPFGFAAPFILQAKCLFQQLWKLGIQWDEEVPPEYVQRFHSWISDLQLLRQWHIPRNYTGQCCGDVSQLELHGFGDASPRAYGACVYMKARLTDGSSVTSLVLAKS